MRGEKRGSTFEEGQAVALISALLFRLYGINWGFFRRVILWVLWWVEGTGIYSRTLRRIAIAYHDVSVGMYTRGPLAAIDHYPPGTVIGRYSSIHPTVRVFGANHPMNTLSTHAIFYNPRLGAAETDLLSRTKLRIGNDVFIGYGAIITSSVSEIGDGAVIGAGSVVHQNVPAFAIVVGNPGRVVRYRFSKEIIEQTVSSKWWDKPLAELLPDFRRFQTPLEGKQVR